MSRAGETNGDSKARAEDGRTPGNLGHLTNEATRGALTLLDLPGLIMEFPKI